MSEETKSHKLNTNSDKFQPTEAFLKIINGKYQLCLERPDLD
jgi:hypothetical protein